MKRIALVIIALVFSGSAGALNVEIDRGQNAAVFRVDGKPASGAEAVEAYRAGKLVEKCSPVKGAMNFDGKSVSVFKCKAVKRVLNEKTGNESWKSL